METFKVPSITVDEAFASYFSSESFPKEIRGNMILSGRIGAQNFRIRESKPGYESHWHVAGDPTFIVILEGVLRIILRDGSFKDFQAGDMFIAKDWLPKNISFDDQQHGHKAEVIGEAKLRALHIKMP